MDTNRKTAASVGVLYIIGTVAGVTSVPVMGGMLEGSDVLNTVAAHPSQVAFGALLMLVMGLALAMIPALMFPILKRRSEAAAIGYIIFRGALETFATLAVALCWLLLVIVARQFADSATVAASKLGSLGASLVEAPDSIMAVGSIVFSLGALMLYCLLYQANLIPRWISGWGILAAVLYLTGGLLALFGPSQDMLLLPMLPQEMVMAVWLIVKGFNQSALAPAAARTAAIERLSAA